MLLNLPEDPQALPLEWQAERRPVWVRVTVKYVKKVALDTQYAISFWNTYEYVKFPVIKTEKKFKLDPVKFCPEYV